MTVQQLIDLLNMVQNKEREVAFCVLSNVTGIDAQESPDGPVLLYTQ
jgi:hypothetical protein